VEGEEEVEVGVLGVLILFLFLQPLVEVPALFVEAEKK
jgi:hypothetical protein